MAKKDPKKRTLLWMIGILLCALGILSLFFDELTVIMAGVGIFFYGVGMLINWTGRRKTGTGGSLLLAGAVVAMVCGVLILFGGRFGILAARIVFFILAAWLIAAGVLEIISAVIYRKAMTSVELGTYAPGSVSSFVIGIIMVSLGGISAFHPFFSAILLRVMVSIFSILLGTRLIMSAFFTDKLWRAKRS